MTTIIPKGRDAYSDGADTNANIEPFKKITENGKTLIIYFSRSGNTEFQAKFAQNILGADCYELVVESPYPSDYQASVIRATDEREHLNWPELVLNDLPDLEQYDLILLGHPIWAMTPANPMRQFLVTEGSRLAGKTIASFSTNAGYGAGDTQDILSQLLPATTTILSNYTVHDIFLERTTVNFKNWLQQLQL